MMSIIGKKIRFKHKYGEMYCWAEGIVLDKIENKYLVDITSHPYKESNNNIPSIGTNILLASPEQLESVW